jgi:pimeloyl-ACP methyl ester carboxylesterase
MHTDAALVRGQLDQLLEEGKEVVLILHSYGGVVGTEAAAGLGLKARQKNGQTGGVIGLFYMAAFILAKGESLLSMCGGTVPPHLEALVSLTCHPVPLWDLDSA